MTRRRQKIAERAVLLQKIPERPRHRQFSIMNSSVPHGIRMEQYRQNLAAAKARSIKLREEC